MESLLYPDIRNTVRAVIIRDGSILLQKKHDSVQGTRYTLPGGAQECGESLEQTLQRECQEEIAVTVEPLCIMHVADYFRQKSLPDPHTRHQLEILFSCRIPDDYVPQNGYKPDKNQVEICWVAIDQLHQYPVVPSFIVQILDTSLTRPIYLGKFC